MIIINTHICYDQKVISYHLTELRIEKLKVDMMYYTWEVSRPDLPTPNTRFAPLK